MRYHSVGCGMASRMLSRMQSATRYTTSRSHDAVIRVYNAEFVTSRVLNRNVKLRHPQRAGIACFGFMSGPAAFVGCVPLTRAKNPWVMPETST